MEIKSHFEEESEEYELTINVDGEGTVIVDLEWDVEEEIVGDEKTFEIPDGTEVTLTAEADEDWEFI